MQFDLFNDSRDVALRNDVIEALLGSDAEAARRANGVLAQHNPQDECLASLNVLIAALEQRNPTAFRDHSDAEAACQHLQHAVEPAARRNLGERAPSWMRQRWLELAPRAQSLSYRADHPDAHAAPLYLRAAHWQAAADAVERIASWRRIPAPLGWMLQARLALLGLPANWGLLAELAWLAPDRLEAAAPHCGDPQLRQWLSQFDRAFDQQGGDADRAWFPAWLLTERPSLAPPLAQAQAGQHSAPEQGMRLMLELLGLERQGRHSDMISHRKALLALHPVLFKCYMSTR